MNANASAETAKENQGDNTPASVKWSLWTRRTMVIILLFAGVYIVSLVTPLLPMISAILILTVILFAPARAITRHTSLSYVPTIILLYAILTAATFFLIIIFVPDLINWGERIAVNVENAYVEVREVLEDYEPEDGIIPIFNSEIDLNSIIEPVRDLVVQGPSISTTPAPETVGGFAPYIDVRAFLDAFGNIAGDVTQAATSLIAGAAGVLTQIFFVYLLTFLLLLQLPRAYDTFFDLLPSVYHREYMLLIDRVIRVWSGFLNGQVLTGVLIGCVTWLQLVLMGIPAPNVLAVVTGIVAPIPVIGTFITLIPLMLASLLQGSTIFTDMPRATLTLAVLVINFSLQQIIWTRIATRSMGKTVALPVSILAVGLVAGVVVGGAGGIFLVSPLLGTLRVILAYILKKLEGKDPYPDEQAATFLQDILFAPGKRHNPKALHNESETATPH